MDLFLFCCSTNTEPNMNSLDGLCAHLRLLFSAMSKATKPIIPALFITCLRTVCPQFATQTSPESEKEAAIGGLLPMLRGRFAQQDANECWTQLMLAIQRVPINLSSVAKVPVSFFSSSNFSLSCVSIFPSSVADVNIEPVGWPLPLLSCHWLLWKDRLVFLVVSGCTHPCFSSSARSVPPQIHLL